MAIPSKNDFYLPILQAMSDGQIRSRFEICELVANKLNLTEKDRAEMLPSETQLKYQNRADWALFDLYKAELFERPQNGKYCISIKGLNTLKETNLKIDQSYLLRLRKSQDSINSRNTDEADEKNISSIENVTPEEDIEKQFKILKSKLSDELIDVLKSISPPFFEQLVIDLLLKMGYGGSREEAGKAIGKTGDGGIDGIINEDRLGLDKIYIQAKRWEGSVSRPTVQAFVGSLSEHHAKKGIFITTSSFTKEAKLCVEKVEHQVSLIDGEKLVKLMIEHNLGVNISNSYEIKKIDRDYFSEENI